MNKKQIKDAIAAEKLRHEKAMKDLHSKLRVFELEEEMKSRNSYQNKKERLKITGNWLAEKNILSEGDIVKVTGSRAGPYRKITSILYYTIYGQLAQPTKHSGWLFSGTTVTSHGFNKITHIWKNGSFISVEDLMKSF